MRARRATQRSAHPICTRSTEISARNQSVHFVFVQLGHGSFRLDNQKETIFAFSYSISLGACTCRARRRHAGLRSEEHTSELQSLMRISYAVFCLKKKKNNKEQ